MLQESFLSIFCVEKLQRDKEREKVSMTETIISMELPAGGHLAIRRNPDPSGGRRTEFIQNQSGVRHPRG